MTKVVFDAGSMCEVSLEVVQNAGMLDSIRVSVDCGETGFIDLTPQNIEALRQFVAALDVSK